MDAFTTSRDKSRWAWTLLLMVPDWIDRELFCIRRRAGRCETRPARLDDVRLEPLSEGRCVQTLHVGSFDDETAVLDRLHHEVIPGEGLRLAGQHHVYLSDFRKVVPEKQRTILRQPVSA